MGIFLLFDIGGGELIVILLFILLFFGSKGIPDVARALGRTLRQVRDATAEVQREIEKGAGAVKQEFQEQRRTFQVQPPEYANPQRTTGASPIANDGQGPEETGHPDGSAPAMADDAGDDEAGEGR
jgi:TatA/E family protein of Tat protein translocase